MKNRLHLVGSYNASSPKATGHGLIQHKADSVGSNQPRCANFHQFTGQPGLALGSATTRDPQRDPQGRRTGCAKGWGKYAMILGQ